MTALNQPWWLVKGIYGSKNECILNLLIHVPWWVSVVVSGASYLILKFILPSIDLGSTMANAFAKGLSGAAPFVALVLLLPAQISALNSWRKKRLLDSQKGIDSSGPFGMNLGACWKAYRRQGMVKGVTPGPDEGDLVLKDGDLVLVNAMESPKLVISSASWRNDAKLRRRDPDNLGYIYPGGEELCRDSHRFS
jgi:hypothetical protein